MSISLYTYVINVFIWQDIMLVLIENHILDQNFQKCDNRRPNTKKKECVRMFLNDYRHTRS